MRTSLDNSADWVSSRPFVLGEDRFRRLTFFHFPEMLGTDSATRTRVFQYRFPPRNLDPIHPPSLDPAQSLATKTINPEYNLVLLPGPAIRAPLWMRPELSRTVQHHLVGLLEAEPSLTSCADPKKEARRLAKLAEALQLFNIDLASIAGEGGGKDVSMKGAGKKRKSGGIKKQAEVEAKMDQLAFAVAQATDPNLHLAPFAFISMRISCGLVPLSLRGKHGVCYVSEGYFSQIYDPFHKL